VIHHDRRARGLAICLAGLAGFVDALGFIALGGFFISFMSGNSTRLAVGLAEQASTAALAAGLICDFVLGVILGTLVGQRLTRHRRPAVLGLVAAMLAGAAALNMLGFRGAAIAAMTLAMGAENTVFERDGEVSIGVTYMTGTLVKLGQRIAGALRGQDRRAWIPYLLLWLGLMAGALLGALAYPVLGLGGLWIAAAFAAALAAVAATLD
jgi:uncharacterized membrane protein YoaK (UPF0700 family)